MSTKLDYIEPKVGQIYEIERNNDHYQIIYVDEKIVLLRSDDPARGKGNSHRIERRTEFDRQIEAGWFKHRPDSKIDMLSFDEQNWSEVDYIGEKTSSNLHENDYKTFLDIQQADDDELLDVSGLGNAGLQNLRDFAR